MTTEQDIRARLERKVDQKTGLAELMSGTVTRQGNKFTSDSQVFQRYLEELKKTYKEKGFNVSFKVEDKGGSSKKTR